MWFENWKIVTSFINKKVRKLRIELPNSATEKVLVLTQGKPITKRQITELEGILLSAFAQIQKDNGGYRGKTNQI